MPKHNITRGGQTYLHRLRMLIQVLWLWFSVLLLSWILIFILTLTINSKPHYPTLKYWLQAQIELRLPTFNLNNNSKISDSKRNKKYNKKLQQQKFLHSAGGHYIELQIINSIKLATASTLLLGLIILSWLRYRGAKIGQAKLLSGRFLGSAKQLQCKIKRGNTLSPFTLAKVALPYSTLQQHFLVHGSTGTGKSVAINSLLDKIRAAGDTAIIYDKHGTFMQHYFCQSRDYLLNPLDKRTAIWDLWLECNTQSALDDLAKALIPQPKNSGDPFWIMAARMLFATSSWKLLKQGNPNIADLLETLFSADISKLQELVVGTEAESLVSSENIKVLTSVQSVLAAYLRPLRCLGTTDSSDNVSPFAINQWLQSAQSNSWLFIASCSQHHETLKPLISAWLNVAASGLMALPANTQRRVWIIIDELPSLHNLPSLIETLAEARKFGGCIVLGTQSFEQLQQIYGAYGAESIVDLCNTRLFFRSPSAATSKWVAKELGEGEYLELREGMSYGANTVRDGVSISQHRVLRPAVPPEVVSSLPNLNAILSVTPSNNKKTNLKWPLAKIKFKWKLRQIIAPALELRDDIEFTAKNIEPADTSETNGTEINKTKPNAVIPSSTPDKKTTSGELIDLG
jgi:type IV conjugative transfer system coupling protein TraD